MPIPLGRLLPPMWLSRPALSGVPKLLMPPPLLGKFSAVALLGGAPIMPSVKPRFPPMPSPPGVMPENMVPPPGGAPSAERIMSFMRMYWYLERCETCVYDASGRGRWRASAAIMESFSSSESTAPDGSRSSGRGAFASMAAPGKYVSKSHHTSPPPVKHTLLFGLVLLLVLRKQHIIWQASSRDTSLQAH